MKKTLKKILKVRLIIYKGKIREVYYAVFEKQHKKHIVFPFLLIFSLFLQRICQKWRYRHIKKDVYWRFPLTVRNLASFETLSKIKQRWTLALVWYWRNSIISHVGFTLLESYRVGQCESLEPWERVTRFPRFSFCSNRSWGVGGTKTKSNLKYALYEKSLLNIIITFIMLLCMGTKVWTKWLVC